MTDRLLYYNSSLSLRACRAKRSGGIRLGGLCLLLLLHAPNTLQAQWVDSVTHRVDRFLGEDGAKAAEGDSTAGKLRVYPVPVVGYQPITSLYLGVAGLATMNALPEARPSQATLDLSYSLNQQLILRLTWSGYSARERYYTTGELGYRFFPENYWGIGPSTPPANKERYDTKRIEGKLSWLRNVWPARSLFVGLRLRYQQLYDLTPEPGGLIARGRAPGHAGYRAAGAGLQLLWDTRDNPLYPTSGHYADLRNLYFHPWLGSTRKLAYWRIDLRQYHRFSGDSSGVWALQLRGEFTRGTPPLRLMPWLGDSDYLRGYYAGRFRDRQLLTAQLAYRREVWWRFGAVAFFGAGVVAPQPAAFRFRHLKPAGGLGLRFTLDRSNHANITADYAVGLAGNSGFYLGFGEQF
jgi:outer membrane protein assembly factor BamA